MHRVSPRRTHTRVAECPRIAGGICSVGVVRLALMVQPLRFARRAPWALALVPLLACSPQPLPDVEEDVTLPPRDACTTAACRDSAVNRDGGDGAVDMDGSVTDPDGGGGGDGSVVPSDVPVVMADGDGGAGPDGSVVVGRCTGVMAAPLVLGTEPRQLARRVFVSQSAAGFFAGYTIQNLGADTVTFQRISTAGASLGTTSVAPDFEGSRMGGGAFTVTPTGFSSVLHSNSLPGGLDVYLQRLDAMGARTGAVVRVSDDRELSEDPQVVRTSRGEVVVWRSTMDMLGGQRVMASLVNGAAPGTPASITPMMTQAGAFDAVTDGTRVAVGLVARNGGNGDVFLVILDAGGVVQRTVQLTTGAFVTESVSVALMGADAVVAWTDRQPAGTLRLRRVNLETGAAGPLSVVPELGFDVSQAAIAVDRDGLAAVFRTVTPMGPRVSVARLGPTLALREGSSPIAPSGPGDQVRIVSRGDGTFGIAWADETSSPMSTTIKFQVVRCP
jgi:hypothetical protein